MGIGVDWAGAGWGDWAGAWEQVRRRSRRDGMRFVGEGGRGWGGVGGGGGAGEGEGEEGWYAVHGRGGGGVGWMVWWRGGLGFWLAGWEGRRWAWAWGEDTGLGVGGK